MGADLLFIKQYESGPWQWKLKSKKPRFLALLCLPFILSGLDVPRQAMNQDGYDLIHPGKSPQFLESHMILEWRALNPFGCYAHHTNVNNHCHSTRAVSLAWPLVSGGFYALHARCDSYLRPFMYFMIVSGLRGSTLS